MFGRHLVDINYFHRSVVNTRLTSRPYTAKANESEIVNKRFGDVGLSLDSTIEPMINELYCSSVHQRFLLSIWTRNVEILLGTIYYYVDVGSETLITYKLYALICCNNF